MQDNLAPKQLEFILDSTAQWNIAHGSMSAGKTVAAVFRFMQWADQCTDSNLWMIGHTSTTIYENAIRLILESRPKGIADPLAIFRPFCGWNNLHRRLLFKDKVISTVGAKDKGSAGAIQGRSMTGVYCDEMALFPHEIIDLIDTRVRNPGAKGFATMNPGAPSHPIKKWIDKAIAGDPAYYQLHFCMEDNPFLEDSYIDRVKNSMSGVFYKRNYLGLWCLAEGAIFDFFDKEYHVLDRPETSAEYYILGVDYGTKNAFAAVLIGVNTGKYLRVAPTMWVEDEYYWDQKVKGRQKVSSEYANDLQEWLEMHPIKAVYVDPSAANFKLELQRKGMRVVDANNDVKDGITKMINSVKSGELKICRKASNLIREVEGYVWDSNAAEKGRDEPLKQNDHAIDALRYAVASHRIASFDADEHYRKQEIQLRQRNNFGWSQF